MTRRCSWDSLAAIGKCPLDGKWVSFWHGDYGVALSGGHLVSWTALQGGLVLTPKTGIITQGTSALLGGRTALDCSAAGIMLCVHANLAITGPVVVVYSASFGITVNSVFAALAVSTGGNRAIYSYGFTNGLALETFRDGAGAEATQAGIAPNTWLRVGSAWDGSHTISILPTTSASGPTGMSTQTPDSLSVGGFSSPSQAIVRHVGVYVPTKTGDALIAEVQSVLHAFASM